MAAERGKFAIPILIQRRVGSACATQAAAVVALPVKRVMLIQIQIHVVNVAAIQRVAAAAMQGLSATVIQLHRVVDFVRHPSAAVVRLVSCVIQQPASAFVTIPAAVVVQPVPLATPMPTLKLVANACATRPAAAIAQRVRCATLIRILIAAAFAEWTQRAVLRGIAIRIAALAPVNLFAPV